MILPDEEKERLRKQKQQKDNGDSASQSKTCSYTWGADFGIKYQQVDAPIPIPTTNPGTYVIARTSELSGV